MSNDNCYQRCSGAEIIKTSLKQRDFLGLFWYPGLGWETSLFRTLTTGKVTSTNRVQNRLVARFPARLILRLSIDGWLNLSDPYQAPSYNGPYAPFGFESIEKQLWRNKQNDRPISDSEIKAVLSQLFKTDQWLPPVGHVSEDVTSHA
ncbi:hypothetical protein AVEN_43636-1 [Araneus ventricosus]|uniref:Uncharacterized protein n=1 Tax=Araneus ventricosus TaxID=182803 RepID=A0A4Y2FCJ2_ARAVE|nr:hypothetical protein AVEN_43636-1 [Araneus ventricosus]